MAGPPLAHAPALRAARQRRGHGGADAAAVRPRTREGHAQPALAVSPIVAQVASRAVVLGQHQVEIAVAVEIAAGSAAANHRLLERGPDLVADRLEALVPRMAEKGGGAGGR